MPAPLILAAGTTLQLIGQWGANIQQAIAEKANAQFYREQEQFARLASERAEQVAAFDYSYKIGEQVSAYAGSGVDMSGSAEVTVGGTISNAIREIVALREKGRLDVRLASMRAQQAQTTADTLSSPGYNLMQGAGTLLRSYGAYKGA